MTSPHAPASLPFAKLPPAEQRQRLRDLAIVFLKLGAIAFGGPAAHTALIQDEVVTRRQWLTSEALLDLIGVTNLIPGPNSTELAIHIGYERGGWRGLAIAGVCFILPAALIVWVLAMVYVRYQSVPALGWLMYGIKPVIIAIIVQALGKLGRKAAKDWPTTLAGVAVMVAFFVQIDEILLLVLAGLAVMVIKNRRLPGSFSGLLWLPLPLAQMTASSEALAIAWHQVFWFFLKIGSVLYGGGYVLLAFLQRDLVERSQWLTSQQLLDAIAIGQVTPGPLFTTATFVGYVLAGHRGAIAATVGIFLPGFLLVGLVNPWVPKLRRSPWVSSFLDGVNAASLGLMATVTYTLGRAALVDGLTIALAILSTVLVFRFKINAVWLVLAGGLLGFLSQSF